MVYILHKRTPHPSLIKLLKYLGIVHWLRTREIKLAVYRHHFNFLNFTKENKYSKYCHLAMRIDKKRYTT